MCLCSSACLQHDFIELGDDTPDDDDGMKPKKFEEARNLARLAKNSLTEAKSKNKHMIALNIGFKAIEQLQFCTIDDEADEAERTTLFVYFYTQAADCYIRCENYSRALLMCKELRQLTDVDRDVELLLIQAIASGHVNDDYKMSIELLRMAQKIEPYNEKVNAKLGEFVRAERKQRSSENDFCRRAFGGGAVQATPKHDDDLEMETLVNSIERMDIGEGMPLIGYTKRQLDAIDQLIGKKHNLMLHKTAAGNGRFCYAIKKKI